MDLPRHRRLISSSGPGVQNEQLRVDGVRCQGALIIESVDSISRDGPDVTYT